MLPNDQICDWSQLPMAFDLSLSQSAGYHSLDRLAECLVSEKLPPCSALLPGLVDKKDVEDEEHDWTQKESAD